MPFFIEKYARWHSSEEAAEIHQWLWVSFVTDSVLGAEPTVQAGHKTVVQLRCGQFSSSRPPTDLSTLTYIQRKELLTGFLECHIDKDGFYFLLELGMPYADYFWNDGEPKSKATGLMAAAFYELNDVASGRNFWWLYYEI